MRLLRSLVKFVCYAVYGVVLGTAYLAILALPLAALVLIVQNLG